MAWWCCGCRRSDVICERENIDPGATSKKVDSDPCFYAECEVTELFRAETMSTSLVPLRMLALMNCF